MSDKVKLRRKTINVLDSIRAKGFTNEEIVKSHINNSMVRVNCYELVADLPTDCLIRALYIGYEIEETPEDKVREYYLSYEREQHWTVCNHIKSVLELLGITIEGVNA